MPLPSLVLSQRVQQRLALLCRKTRHATYLPPGAPDEQPCEQRIRHQDGPAGTGRCRPDVLAHVEQNDTVVRPREVPLVSRPYPSRVTSFPRTRRSANIVGGGALALAILVILAGQPAAALGFMLLGGILVGRGAESAARDKGQGLKP